MELIIVTIALVALAFWQRSSFLQIVAGVVAIGFGLYWITEDPSFIYLMEGIAFVGTGIYMLIMVGADLLGRGE